MTSLPQVPAWEDAGPDATGLHGHSSREAPGTARARRGRPNLVPVLRAYPARQSRLGQTCVHALLSHSPL